MKLPSLKYLYLKSINTLYRFPFTIGIALLGTIASIYVTDFDYTRTEDYTLWYHLIMVCAIGVPMFISISVFSERLEVTPMLKFLIRLGGFIFLLLYFISLPDIFLEKHYIRMLIWLLLFHMLVSFSPYIGFRNQYSFWQFNKALFERFLITVLYSVVIYSGISLAMLATDHLFNVNIRGEWYLRLWILVVGLFSVWFFLAGIPRHYRKLDVYKPFPSGLKIFTQYILIPLVAIYAIILYAYCVKILLTRDWPVGWVVYLVLGYSVLGIFSYLLLFPAREEVTGKWIRHFSAIFFYSLFPLLIMLFVAIFKRVSEYGLTENRMFVILLGIWLVFNAVFIIVTKYKMIRIIPVSMSVLAFISINGPWNVFALSKMNQQKRFEILLEKNNMLKNNKAVKPASEIPAKDDVEICSVITYMVDVHGYKSLQPYFSANLDTIFRNDTLPYYMYNYQAVSKLADLMGIEYNLYSYYGDSAYYPFSFSSLYGSAEEPMNISGFDYMISYRAYCYPYGYDSLPQDTILSNTFLLPDSSRLNVFFDRNKGDFSIKSTDSVIFSHNIFDFLKDIENKEKTGNRGYYTLHRDTMALTSDSIMPACKIFFTYISGNRENEGYKQVNEIQGTILYRHR